MTDPGLADATYIEPITAEAVKIILGKENPMQSYRQWGTNRS